MREFKEMVKKLHAAGLKFILDAVQTYTGKKLSRADAELQRNRQRVLL